MNEQQASTAPDSNTKAHPSHDLLTPEDFVKQPELARRHPYLKRDVEAGFQICKACQAQGVKNLGNPCKNRTPKTRVSRVASAVRSIIQSRMQARG